MPIKLINVGDTGAGKSSALLSLAAAGYQVRILDLDNGMDALIDLMTDPKSPYPKHTIENIRWKTITEPMRAIGGNFVPKSATVWQRMTEMLENWKGDERTNADGQRIPCEDKLGPVSSWGQDCICALDTLSTAGTAAMNFYLMMNGALGKKRSSMESMRDIGAAQDMLDKFLQYVFDTSIKCNFILNTHVVFAKEDGKNAEPGYDGPIFAFPAAIGKALSPKMGKYFNHLLLTKLEGSQRAIYTKGIPNIGLKSGAPLKVQARYDIKDGFAKYFEAIQGPLPKGQPIGA